MIAINGTGTEFSDTADLGVHTAAVKALADDGVLDGTGCGDGRLCPRAPLQRWEMAVWLVRFLDGTDPAPADTSRFDDIDADTWWAAHVERLIDLGITKGCAEEPLRYCPDEPVNRAQMASFLKRAFQIAGADSAGFVDTRGNTHESSIDALYAAGITNGCVTEPLQYCPADPVTRAQTATLLDRARNRDGLTRPASGTDPTIEDPVVAGSTPPMTRHFAGASQGTSPWEPGGLHLSSVGENRDAGRAWHSRVTASAERAP